LPELVVKIIEEKAVELENYTNLVYPELLVSVSSGP
jgi:hypothetical protein